MRVKLKDGGQFVDLGENIILILFQMRRIIFCGHFPLNI